MKRSVLSLVLFGFALTSYAADNQIYIVQTNATNSQIDIEQLGSGNIVADNASNTTTVNAAMNINGTGLNFNLDQIGNSNKFLTDLNGNDGTYNFTFTGGSNVFTGQLNAAGVNNMNDFTFTNAVTGTSNQFTVNISGDADTNDSDIVWAFDGDDNIVFFNAGTDYAHSNLSSLFGNSGNVTGADADNMNLNWDVDGDDNVFKVAINSPYVNQDWDITGDNNTVDYIGIGNANASSDATGHISTINITGDYWDVDLIQRSTNNNDWVNINATGSGTSGSHATLCIVQNDSGSAAGC
tara:strand:- start:464 stop:1351 length:888 start_codon:yes stop_codon:yes gene_type:complete